MTVLKEWEGMDCAECGEAFTKSTWENDRCWDGPDLLDVHEHCCRTCQRMREEDELLKSSCPSCEYEIDTGRPVHIHACRPVRSQPERIAPAGGQ